MAKGRSQWPELAVAMWSSGEPGRHGMAIAASGGEDKEEGGVEDKLGCSTARNEVTEEGLAEEEGLCAP